MTPAKIRDVAAMLADATCLVELADSKPIRAERLDVLITVVNEATQKLYNIADEMAKVRT